MLLYQLWLWLISLACHLEISPKTTKHSTLLVKPQSIPLWKFKLHISQLTSFLEKFLSKKFIKFVGRTILQKEKKKKKIILQKAKGRIRTCVPWLTTDSLTSHTQHQLALGSFSVIACTISYLTLVVCLASNKLNSFRLLIFCLFVTAYFTFLFFLG